MASIERRTTKSDGVRFKVRWREGGRREGDWDCETFDDQWEAKRFKALVDANRNRRPSLEHLLSHDFAYLLPASLGPRDRPTPPVGEARDGSPVVAPEILQPSVTFEEFARQYVDRLVRPNRETKRKYLERLVRQPPFVIMSEVEPVSVVGLSGSGLVSSSPL